MSPTHGPARARPRRPTHRTTAVPRMAIVMRWGVVPAWNPNSQDDGASSKEVSGGCAALWAVPKATRKNWPMDSPRPVKPYHNASYSLLFS